ncbi:glycoside hydrolase family 11 protein [Apiospora arundinis]|uniref:Endo-1,4-beta-xylanase n=1 Tax=Apiospora arundinis TaxID=335852 RepID=A0ABR2JPN9_9PEZI
MVAFTHLTFALSAIASVFAAPVADPDAPDFELAGANGTLARRQDYNQNYKTSGNVNFSPTSNGYSVQFSGAQDFVVGKGWSTGARRQNPQVLYTNLLMHRTITFSGSTTASSGTVLVSVYGWSTNPLVEYYIQEYSNGQGAAQGQQMGTYTSDGSTYTIWKHTQVNQPSIQGTSTFPQYISVRQQARPNGGSINVGNHFDAWKAKGLNLGSLNYQTLSTEGWGGAGGSSQYTVSGK